MLLIKTYLAASAVQGLGVFAAEPVTEGDEVWVLDPRIDFFIPRERYDELPDFAVAFLDSHAYADHSVYPDGYIYSTDHAKFINHSRDPNTSTTGSRYLALRDIAAGEEITCDYREFSWMDQPRPEYI